MSEDRWPPIDPFLREHPEGCSLAVRAQPGAKCTAITGIYGEGHRPHVNIAVKAPAVEGKANEILLEYLAALFKIPRLRIAILYGETGRIKVILLRKIKVSEAMAVIGPLLADLGWS